MPITAEAPTNRQRLVIGYLFGVLIDLVVLNLFAELWGSVVVASFSWSLLAAILLQALLKATLALEQRVTAFFKARQGALMTFLRFLGAWLVLFLSKFVILEALNLVLGDKVRFEGAMYGLVPLMVVVATMVLAEEAVLRFVRWLR
nr:hypothetical protein [Sphingomonas naasensis]